MFKRSFANSERKTTTAPSTTLRRGAGADRVGAGPRSRPGRCEQAFDGVTSSGGPLAAATEPIRPPSGEEACLVPPVRRPARTSLGYSGGGTKRQDRRGRGDRSVGWPRKQSVRLKFLASSARARRCLMRTLGRSKCRASEITVPVRSDPGLEAPTGGVRNRAWPGQRAQGLHAPAHLSRVSALAHDVA